MNLIKSGPDSLLIICTCSVILYKKPMKFTAILNSGINAVKMNNLLITATIGTAGKVSGGDYTAGIIAAVLILFFLIYTLLKPEKF